MSNSTDVEIKSVSLWTAAFFFVILASALLLWLIFHGDVFRYQASESNAAIEETFTAPRLEEEEGAQLKALREKEERILTGYAWSHENPGRAQVPISRAMEDIIENGLPDSLNVPSKSGSKGEAK